MSTRISAEDAGFPDGLTATEHAVSELWREVLQIDGQINATDNFFALGGSSIEAVLLLFRIKEELGVDLPDTAGLDAPTLRELSAVVDTFRRRTAPP